MPGLLFLLAQIVRVLFEPNAVISYRMKHEPCSEQIVLSVAPTLREEIERAASNEGRSLANMTRRKAQSNVRFRG
jgi:hypothetical protein